MRVPIRKPGKYTGDKADTHFTAAKFDELKDKLEGLKKARPLAADGMRRLAEMGDLSENAAYQIAKGRLRGINDNITKLENLLNQAVIIAPKNDSDIVEIGNIVTVEMGGMRKTFTILGSSETDPLRGIISHHSPLGAALMGRKIGDVFFVQMGDKKISGKILSIR